MKRREAMIGLGQVGLGSLTLPHLLRAESAAAAAPRPPLRGQAKACILVFLWGGPPQQDMWDIKPDAPEGIRSHFKPIHTAASGIEICDQMPLMAKVTDRVTIVRSVTHGSDNHEPSVYHMLTGKVNPSLVVPRNQRRRSDFPSPGAILSCLSPPGPAPASVTLPRPIQHDGVKYAGTWAGFLGAQHDPVELPDTPLKNGRPELDFPASPGLDTGRLLRRRGLLASVEAADRHLQENPAALGMDAFRERAFGLLASPAAKRAFDLEQETGALRDRYGRNHYGESFLLARRLVEAGVRLVTINWMFFRPDANPLNPWDNHGGTPALGGVSGYAMLKADYCIPPLDRAYAALIEDLTARGLLDETLVVMMGEFGRTPKINAQQGRDHWGACQSVVLAGGPVRRGFVHGASDAHAAYPTEDPVRPEDLLATTYSALGIPPEQEILDAERRPHRVSEGEPVTALFG